MSALFDLPILSLLIWLPVIGGLCIAMMKNDQHARWSALILSVVTFLVSISLYNRFELGQAAMQFSELSSWIPAFDIYYRLGVDGISMPLIILTAFTTVLVVLAGWESITNRVGAYMGAFLILEGLMHGVFAALDGMLFYFFWESMLIPMFLIIGIWGGPNRVYATIKFFLYTFLGSVFMLVALLYLYFKSGSFNLLDMHSMPIALEAQKYIFIAFLLAFAVKIPMWPVHTWLPDAHVEAPTGGSVILAAIMLKMGGYGFLRFSLPIVPDASFAFADFMIVLSLIAIAYIGFVALVQTDMKKLIAYSSISHMGFVTLGMFTAFAILSKGQTQGAALGLGGSMMQMISHGFISGALFLCIGVMYDRMHSREIADYGGVVNTMPKFAAFMMLFVMANAGLPGTSGFVGEFMVILGSIHAGFWIAAIASTTLILGASYSLWMYKRVIFGDIANDAVAGLKDINQREWLILAILTVPVLVFGLWPAPLMDIINPSIDALLQHIAISKVGG